MKLAASVVIALSVVAPAAQAAPQVWSGYDYTFSKENWADPTLPENQDRITDNIWITRDSILGIFNAKTETMYDPFISPADTEWAFGQAADWESLTFSTWKVWHANLPLEVIGKDAVVHLISDDIYLDIKFLSWQAMGQGGAFSYVRAIPAPGSAAIAVLAGTALARRRR